MWNGLREHFKILTMPVKLKDIACGKGPEYILFVKHNGEYRVDHTGGSVFEIYTLLHDRIKEVMDKDKLEAAMQKIRLMRG